MVIGNLIIGETYIEPQGTIEIINHHTGERCELEFKQRGWTTSNKESVLGVIKDENNKAKYHITGKYTKSLNLVNLQTKESKELWQAPSLPESSVRTYGMNNLALQLNQTSEDLLKKLPPTDSRMRPDVRQWEHGDKEEASTQKNDIE